MPTMQPTEAQAAELFRVAFEESPVGMVLCGGDYTIFRVNTAVCALLGYEASELIGKSIADITHPDDVDKSLEHAENGFCGTLPGFSLPKRYVTKQGETRWARLTGNMVRDETGRPIYGLGMIEDLTGGREAEQAMRRSERLASIGTFAAGVAHQINNPLGGILMAAQFALATQENPDSPALMRKALEDIETDARRCGDIVRSVLQFARQDPLETSPCTLDELVQSAIRLTRKDAEGRADLLFLEAQGELPQILVSRTEMEQAISNVLRNAVKSKAEGVRVIIQTDYSDEKAFLVIRDDGEGVPAEHLEYIFDPFYTTRRELGGSGLGLSMAHAIVTAHGGTIEVSSSHASGTTVTIELPLEMPDPEDLQ
jgi:PAS domain S-box-containing protein